jgi:hypothetical protein
LASISKEDDITETWKLFIIEIAVPFGRRDKEDVHSNTLKNVTEFMTNKYAPLVRSINKQVKDKNFRKENFMVEFLPFIISSLGALPNKSINNFTMIIGTATKNTVGLWCKKLAVKALKRSFMIWAKAKPKTLASNNKRKYEINSDDENNNEEERQIAEEIIELTDEELRLGSIYENECDAEQKNLVLELVEEKVRMNELNLPEEAVNDEMKEDYFESYNNKVMNQEEIADYKEVQEEEEFHLIERPNQIKEIIIIKKPSEHPLFPRERKIILGTKNHNTGKSTTPSPV